MKLGMKSNPNHALPAVTAPAGSLLSKSVLSRPSARLPVASPAMDGRKSPDPPLPWEKGLIVDLYA